MGIYVVDITCLEAIALKSNSDCIGESATCRVPLSKVQGFACNTVTSHFCVYRGTTIECPLQGF